VPGSGVVVGTPAQGDAEQTRGPRRATHALRADIQALRAGTVALVVLFHSWPELVPGGYVGVDVFFVISGYLITKHLFDEIERSGTVALLDFWARRARRLLPASMLVLAATASSGCGHWLGGTAALRALLRRRNAAAGRARARTGAWRRSRDRRWHGSGEPRALGALATRGLARGPLVLSLSLALAVAGSRAVRLAE
jgi:hypothetical protein